MLYRVDDLFGMPVAVLIAESADAAERAAALALGFGSADSLTAVPLVAAELATVERAARRYAAEDTAPVAA